MQTGGPDSEGRFFWARLQIGLIEGKAAWKSHCKYWKEVSLNLSLHAFPPPVAYFLLLLQSFGDRYSRSIGIFPKLEVLAPELELPLCSSKDPNYWKYQPAQIGKFCIKYK